MPFASSIASVSHYVSPIHDSHSLRLQAFRDQELPNDLSTLSSKGSELKPYDIVKMAEDAAAKSAAMEAMMADLGDHRLEDLARHSRDRGPSTLVNPQPPRVPTGPGCSAEKYGSDVAKMFREAIANGEFNDWDAAGASRLDPIGHGNEHRKRNGKVHQPEHENPRPYFVKASTSKQNRYDPMRPTYYRGKKIVKLARTENLKVSAFGAVVPDGGQVKTWDGQNQTQAVNSKENPTVTQTCQPRMALSEIQGIPSRDGNARERTAYSNYTIVAGPSRANEIRPKLGALPIPAVVPRTLETGAPPGKVSPRATPHLRQPSEEWLIDFGSSSTSEHGSSILGDEKDENTHSEQEDSTRDPSSISNLNLRSVLLRAEVFVLEESDGESEPVKGHIVLYEVGIWELKMKDRMVRGDARRLLSVLTKGHVAYLRRYDGVEKFRSTPMRFPNFNEMEKFKNGANKWMLQYKFWGNSPTPFDEEVIDLLPVRDVMAPLPIQSHRAQGQTITDAAVAATKALRDMDISNGLSLVDYQEGEWRRIFMRAFEHRMVLTRRAELLTVALEHHPAPQNPAFQVSLLHLMETDGFLSLSHDEQRKCLMALYMAVSRGDARIVYSTGELLSLRSDWDICPKEIIEFRALTQDMKRASM